MLSLRGKNKMAIKWFDTEGQAIKWVKKHRNYHVQGNAAVKLLKCHKLPGWAGKVQRRRI